MGERGPKPEPIGTLTILHGDGKLPKPFSGMSSRAKKTWREIVGSHPPGYFRTGALVLLKAFCEAEAVHHVASMAAQKTLLVKAGQGGLKANPAIAIQTAKSGEMVQLATKLRLAVTSYRAVEDRPVKSRPESVRAGLKFGGRE